jgi:predicted CopG family antitoxin
MILKILRKMRKEKSSLSEVICFHCGKEETLRVDCHKYSMDEDGIAYLRIELTCKKCNTMFPYTRIERKEGNVWVG